MILGFGDLTEDTVRKTLVVTATRAAVAAPFQLLMFWVCGTLRPDWATDSLIHHGLAAMTLVVALRFGVRLVADRMIRRPRGRAVWRLLFASASLLVAATWSALLMQNYRDFGAAPIAMVTHVFCATIAAISTQAFAFEVALNLVFQVVMLVPTAAWLLGSDDAMVRYLGIGQSFYALFTGYLAVSVSRHLKKNLRKTEIIEEQRRALDASHGEMRAMIESIEEAFLSFDASGRCTTESSRAARALLAGEVRDRHFFDLFRQNEDQRARLASWFRALFANPGQFDALVALGPRFCEVAGRTLKLGYFPRRHGDDLSALVVTAIDVTLEQEAARRAKAEKARVDLILGAIENPAAFRDLLEQIGTISIRLTEARGAELANELARVHTVKGQARVLGAGALADLVHALELALRAAPVGNSEAWRASARDFAARFEAWRTDERAFLDRLGLVGERRRSPTDVAAPAPATFDLVGALRGYEAYVLRAARRREKTLRYEVNHEGPLIVNERLRPVVHALVHLFDNAIDHGLERPTERARTGKSPEGLIRVSLRPGAAAGPGRLFLSIHDDGRGLAPGTESRLFDAGFSTAVGVDETCGLGQGLAAVRAAVAAAGGTIAVSSDAAGTTFLLDLPWSGPGDVSI